MKAIDLEEIIDLKKQTKQNNDAMRRVFDFMTEGMAKEDVRRIDKRVKDRKPL